MPPFYRARVGVLVLALGIDVGSEHTALMVGSGTDMDKIYYKNSGDWAPCVALES